MEYLENVGQAPEPQDVSHRLISESHHVEETVGQQPQSVEAQSGHSSVLPSVQEDEVAQKAEKVPLEGDGNHIDAAGPADSSTSYVLPSSSALRHEMEVLWPTRRDTCLLNKHEVIQKLLDILSTCDGAQRQCVFEALLAIDRAEAPQMPDMLMRYPGTLVILIDEIILLTQQLARSKSRPHNAVHRGSGVLRVLQRMAAENEVAQFLKNACIHSMIFPIVTNRHADWATDVEDYVLEALKVYQILVDHIPPHIYTEKHLFGVPSVLECLVNGDLAPKRGSDAEVHRVAEYIICKTLTTRCWVKITQDIRVEDWLLNDFPNIGASFSDVLNTMTSEEDEAARRALLAVLRQLRSRKHHLASSTDRVEVPGGPLGNPSSHHQARNSQSQVTRGQLQHSRSQPGAHARQFQGRHLGSNMDNPSTGDPRYLY
ncbi:hypothetical protein BZA77DRAFT_295714 [Pyronema omphalodes]|nr:hypothetical protein BZA77DRAFT_295714 [Pyronema omphalodes]